MLVAAQDRPTAPAVMRPHAVGLLTRRASGTVGQDATTIAHGACSRHRAPASHQGPHYSCFDIVERSAERQNGFQAYAGAGSGVCRRWMQAGTRTILRG